jgi:uncharacterized membrane protein YqjE
MFIVKRRIAGVVAALAVLAVLAVISGVWDRVTEREVQLISTGEALEH